MSRSSKDTPNNAKSLLIVNKDIGALKTDTYHSGPVEEKFGIGIKLDEGNFLISDIVETGQAYTQGARIGDFLVGINGVDVEDCMTTPYSVAEFSAMMKVAQRPLTLNMNHIRKAAAKARAPPAAPAPKQKTSNPMIPVFIMFAILCAVIIGIWHDDHPIVAGNAPTNSTELGSGAVFGETPYPRHLPVTLPSPL